MFGAVLWTKGLQQRGIREDYYEHAGSLGRVACAEQLLQFRA